MDLALRTSPRYSPFARQRVGAHPSLKAACGIFFQGTAFFRGTIFDGSENPVSGVCTCLFVFASLSLLVCGDNRSLFTLHG